MFLLLFDKFHVCLCFTVLSVRCSIFITCWERIDLLPLLCVLGAFPYVVLGQMWYLIVSIPDLCLSLYFNRYSDSSGEISSHCLWAGINGLTITLLLHKWPNCFTDYNVL